MQIITLTTDWGQKDWYLGQVKGLIYSSIEDANVVDVTHDIDKFNLRQAAFVVKNSCLNFPPGTIHIIDVNTYEDLVKSFVVVKYNQQYYICTDNGLPSIVFDGKDIEITDCINVLASSNYYTFAVLDFFVRVAKVINEDCGIENLGNKLEKFTVPKIVPRCVVRPNSIECSVVYIDDYGNAFLNITGDEFAEICSGRKFELAIDVGVKISSISASYADKQVKGRALLTESSIGNLELAVREDNFARLFGYKIDRKVVIKLQD